MVATPVVERQASRQKLAKQNLALPDGGFPIPDANHWEKARQAIGRVKSPARRQAVAKLLRKTAPRFGKQQALKQSWAAPGGSKNMSNSYHFAGDMTTCPRCGYSGDNAEFKTSDSGDSSSSGTSLEDSPGVLRTPDGGNVSSTGFSPESAGINVRTGPGGAGLSNRGQRALGLAVPMPVTSASDILLARIPGGAAVRHRRGGMEIGQIVHESDGWRGRLPGGKALSPHVHQRAALTELIGTHNRGSLTPQHLPAQRQAPESRTLAAQIGLASDGDGDSSDDSSSSGGDSGSTGLNPKGQAIYKKLIAKGFPPARAKAFAMRAQNATPGKFGTASS